MKAQLDRNDDAAAIIDAVERLSDVSELEVSDPNTDTRAVPYVVVPAGKTIQSLKPILDAFRTKPERRSGTATLTTEGSFIDHVKRFASDDTLVFANVHGASQKPELVTVFDYHPAGPKVTDAAFRQHRALYPFPLSKEWNIWRQHDDKPMEQIDFARFLEDRLLEVTTYDPDADAGLKLVADSVAGTYATPARLLEVARSLEVNASVAVKSAATMATGEVTLQYVEAHDTGAVKVPNLFVLGIPVFREGALYKIACRLRYRLAGTSVKWWYTMVRPEAYFDDAVADVVGRVREQTSRPVLYGAPES